MDLKNENGGILQLFQSIVVSSESVRSLDKPSLYILIILLINLIVKYAIPTKYTYPKILNTDGLLLAVAVISTGDSVKAYRIPSWDELKIRGKWMSGTKIKSGISQENRRAERRYIRLNLKRGSFRNNTA